MEFYERMRELRKEHGETQAQVAAAAGMTDRQYQRFAGLSGRAVGPEGDVEVGFPPFRGTRSCRGVRPVFGVRHCEYSFLTLHKA